MWSSDWLCLLTRRDREEHYSRFKAFIVIHTQCSYVDENLRFLNTTLKIRHQFKQTGIIRIMWTRCMIVWHVYSFFYYVYYKLFHHPLSVLSASLALLLKQAFVVVWTSCPLLLGTLILNSCTCLVHNPIIPLQEQRSAGSLPIWSQSCLVLETRCRRSCPYRWVSHLCLPSNASTTSCTFLGKLQQRALSRSVEVEIHCLHFGAAVLNTATCVLNSCGESISFLYLSKNRNTTVWKSLVESTIPEFKMLLK